MKLEDFKNVINVALKCYFHNITFKVVGKYFIAIITRNDDCSFMITQPLLEVANKLSISHGFQYLDCECGVVRLKIIYEL